jgi:hypothetical protein
VCGSCQLGGNASTVDGARAVDAPSPSWQEPRFGRFGSPRSNIVGLEVVTADGTVLDMRKDTQGSTSSTSSVARRARSGSTPSSPWPSYKTLVSQLVFGKL